MTLRKVVGIDRRLELDWLDATAALVGEAKPISEIRRRLWELLAGPGIEYQSHRALGRTVTVLCRTWALVPESHQGLRGRATRLLADADPETRLAIHWAMLLAAYPFFLDAVGGVGRLLALQNNVALSQLTRRIVESWGDRSTLPRGVQRILRSLVQWGVLKDTATRGVYEAARKKTAVSDEVAELLIEALSLHAEGDATPFDQLIGHAALFPFELRITAHRLRSAKQFRVHRQGLDVDMVELAGGGRR